MPSPSTPLRPPERLVLAQFLRHPDRSEGTLSLAALEGYFVAIAISPDGALPSAWLPGVFNDFAGTAPPNFDTQEHAQKMIGLLMRFYNEVTAVVFRQPHTYVPMRGQQDAEMCAAWCRGFARGQSLEQAAWGKLETAHPDLLRPMAFDTHPPEGFVFGRFEDNDLWRVAIRDSLMQIFHLWHSAKRAAASRGDNVISARKLRSHFTPAPKGIRVNDPCPCGSGKKYKKCCGARV